MFTVIETDAFVRYAQAIWSDAERDESITWIANNSLSGAVIPETGGLRKVRYARQGMGKRDRECRDPWEIAELFFGSL